MAEYLHAPPGYDCPFCNIASGGDDPRVVVWRDELCFAVIGRVHHPNNHGALLLCPVQHHENLYVLPDAIGAHLFSVSKRLALALKHALRCDGVSTRQHNEPAGTQEVWHYHLHITPRWTGDNFYGERPSPMAQEERVALAERIRAALEAGVK